MEFEPEQFSETGNYTWQRHQLVKLIKHHGVYDQQVLDAMAQVPREEFVPSELRNCAYENRPLQIGSGQTISQPLMVAMMTSALELQPTDRVLEIGAGSGYSAAVLAQLAAEVVTVERHRELAERASEVLHRLKIHNVHVVHGDGTQGLPQYAPYDAIVVTAGGPEMPMPLFEQLRIGGRLVMPIGGDRLDQTLYRIRKQADSDYDKEALCEVRFVPLIGEEGWDVEMRSR